MLFYSLCIRIYNANINSIIFTGSGSHCFDVCWWTPWSCWIECRMGWEVWWWWWGVFWGFCLYWPSFIKQWGFVYVRIPWWTLFAVLCFWFSLCVSVTVPVSLSLSLSFFLSLSLSPFLSFSIYLSALSHSKTLESENFKTIFFFHFSILNKTTIKHFIWFSPTKY